MLFLREKCTQHFGPLSFAPPQIPPKESINQLTLLEEREVVAKPNSHDN
jgi:hypothetical protein